MCHVTRHTVLASAAWSVPTVLASTLAPAYATSSPVFDVLFDGGGAADGHPNSVSLHLGTPRETASHVLTAPLTLTVQVVGLLAAATAERDYAAGSSSGTVTRDAYDACTRTTTLSWTLPTATVVPEVGTAVTNPHLLLAFRDGASPQGRITNKVVVTELSGGALTSSKSLPLDSTVQRDVGGISPDGIY